MNKLQKWLVLTGSSTHQCRVPSIICENQLKHLAATEATLEGESSDTRLIPPYFHPIQGPFIFYEVGGAGGIWGGGVTEKKTALKGGPFKKNKGKRGGHVKYFSNALRWDMFYYS